MRRRSGVGAGLNTEITEKIYMRYRPEVGCIPTQQSNADFSALDALGDLCVNFVTRNQARRHRGA